MNLLIGAGTLLTALVISGVAGFFSVIGLGHLFAGAFWPVVVMGTALEVGKLVTASWLKANWSNPTIPSLHRLFLLAQVLVLMLITSLGIYGYLAKGHLEQESSLPAVTLRISQSEQRIAQIAAERDRFEERLKGLDKAVNALLANARTAKETQAADRARQGQRKDRLDIAKQIAARDTEINALNDQLVPLRLQVSDVSAKLGPVKYVAQLFGWQDPNSAVQMVILMIMFAFDPLAVMLVLSGTLTLGAWLRERRAAEGRASLKNMPLTDMAAHLDTRPVMIEDFVGTDGQEKRVPQVIPPPAGRDIAADLVQEAKRPFGGAVVDPGETTPHAATVSIAEAVPSVSGESARSVLETMTRDLARADAERASILAARPDLTPVVEDLRSALASPRTGAASPATVALDTEHGTMAAMSDTIVQQVDADIDLALLRILQTTPGETSSPKNPIARFAQGAWGSLTPTSTAANHVVDLTTFANLFPAPSSHASGVTGASFPGSITSFTSPVAIAPEILTPNVLAGNTQNAPVDFHEFSESMFGLRDK